MKLFIRFLLPLVAVFAFFGCGDDSPSAGPKLSRTVLVYMVANNNLAPNALYDLNEMEIAADNGALGRGGRLLVMCNSASGNKLYEIVRNKSRVLLKTYEPSGADVNSLDSTFMRAVFDDMRAIAPAREYGLILWSHATGWMDEATARLSTPGLRSFGYDNGRRMSLSTLHSALKGQEFDWIYFDCCHMATVEVCYELRDCARYFAGSPTELHEDGMPYHKTIPCLFKETADLTGAARTTFNEYSSSSTGCSMAVIDASRLDYLATATRRVMSEANNLPTDYSGIPYMRRQISPVCTIFDMADYIKALRPSKAVLDSWIMAYNSAVLYSAATKTCFGLDMAGFSGLGANIIFAPTDTSLFNYNHTAWYTDVVSHLATLK